MVLFDRLNRAYWAFHGATTRGVRLFAGLLLLIIAAMVAGGLSEYYDEYAFNHLSPAEHLRLAKRDLMYPSLASRHLEQIPSTAPEYGEVPALLASIRTEEQAHQLALQKEQARTLNQPPRREATWIDDYWSTTLRVDTDMDSFWLKDEERTCQTYPDEKGRVAVVACNPTGSHRDRNIPVKFWGGVDRGVFSSWKCRREGDDFVCRAID